VEGLPPTVVENQVLQATVHNEALNEIQERHMMIKAVAAAISMLRAN
jgi:hypothetical protein